MYQAVMTIRLLNTNFQVLRVYVILYHKSNLVYTVFFPQFLIFQKKIIVPRRKEN